MAFSKSFPKAGDKSAYPRWEEVFLSEEEEEKIDSEARQRNIDLMKESIDDAKKIFKEKFLGDYHADLMSLAIALFEKRASHTVYWKERRVKDKFDEEIRQEGSGAKN